jgi:hypothetical protein
VLKQLLTFLIIASTASLIASLAVCVYTDFSWRKWEWGSRSLMDSSGHTRELILSGGVLSYRRAADWSAAPPAPAWEGGEDFDYNLNFFIGRVYQFREIWYLGIPQPTLSLTSRRALPHFGYSRRGWDIDFNHIAEFLGVATALPVLLRLRLFLRRKVLGHCHRCGYDLRATPHRCPECGFRKRGRHSVGECVRSSRGREYYSVS